MKVVQIVSNLSYGDAIGNEVQSMDASMKAHGYDTTIMALDVHPALKHLAEPISAAAIEPDDIVIFHKAAGDSLSRIFAGLACRKVLLYHNITPVSFFLPYDPIISWNLIRGRKQLRILAKYADWAWGDSSYNCKELLELGYQADRVQLLPILSLDDQKHTQAAPELLRELQAQPGTRILFVGRLAPNKKQEDVIKLFAYYQARVDPQAQLYLVGSQTSCEKYYAKLMGFVADLKLKNVHITGAVTDQQKEAYYRCADVFVCMSEHEGFCVPFLEAMRASVPVVAYDCCAFKDTFGDNGVLFKDKDYGEICDAIKKLREDAAFRQAVIDKQDAQLGRFDSRAIEQRFLSLLQSVCDERVNSKPK
ncbi:MAG: glycosyltransferase [Eubacteriales bacterium]|nr:glycosyltransferase [Eubacteriales bacterium]